jgi:hydrogenase large subunit
MVPGGVTTLFSSTYPLAPQTGTDYDMYGPYNAASTVSKFKSLMLEVRNFINQSYLPDVVAVAANYPQFWSQGQGCMNLLAYGDYPVNATGQLAIKRGRVSGLIPSTFDQGEIREYVGGSYYNYGILDVAGLHPFDGKTTPNMGTAGYSWIKSPRYGTSATVYEVGPLARMVNTHVRPATQVSVSDADTSTTPGDLGLVRVGGSYTPSVLIGAALTLVGQPATALYSALGRHAARALEAKYIADAMAGPGGWVDSLVANAPCYTYKRIPKQISTGYGLTEAPRGALGHWIKIEGRKVAKYQCVVPSTWNFSPNSGVGAGDAGPVEDSLEGSYIGLNPTDQIINILRLVHPFDCCIACAVHVMNPEGKETLRFAIGPDGRPANIEVKE